MPVTLTQLRSNARFRALDVNTQMQLSRQIWENELNQDPRYLAMPPQLRDQFKRDMVLRSATFNDEQLGNFVRDTGVDYAQGKSGALVNKAGYEIANKAITTSGVAGAVSLLLGSQANREDRVRALQYFNQVEELSGRSDAFSAIGGAIGFIGDIVAVNALMAPVTSAARAGVSMAARGIKAAEMPASAVLRDMVLRNTPVLKPKLDFFGPVLAETLVEAVPYFLVEESRRKATGQPTALSQGPMEVAKVLGINAAADFIVGSAAVAALLTAAKTGQQLFLGGNIGKAAYTTAAEFDEILRGFEAGSMNRLVYESLPDITKDRVSQSALMSKYIHRGAANPDLVPDQRSAWLANDLGVIWGKQPEGGYRLWTADESGNSVKRMYANFNELEDDLAYDFYKRYEKLKPEAAKDKIRADNEWAFNRGQMLNRNMNMLEFDRWKDADPQLAALLKTPKSMKRRNVITKSEADFVVSTTWGAKEADPKLVPMNAVETYVPLTGDVRINAKNNEFNLFRGRPIVRVATSDKPNALFVGSSQAPLDVYEATKLDAEKLLQQVPPTGAGSLTPEQVTNLATSSSFSSMDEAVSSLMLTRGYDHVRLPDGTYEFFSSRAARLIGETEDVLTAIRPAIAAGDIATKVVVRDHVAKIVSAADFGRSADKVIAASYDVLKSGDVQKYKDFSRMYLGSDIADTKIQVYKHNGNKVSAEMVNGTLRIGVPDKITGYADQVASAKDLFKGLDELGKLNKTRAKYLKNADFLAKRISENPNKFGFIEGVDPMPWADEVAAKLGGVIEKTDGVYTLHLPTGASMYTSVEDLVSGIAKKTMDTGSIKRDLLMQGMRVVELPNKRVQLRSSKTGALLADELDMQRALDKIGYEPTHVSNAYGPKSVRVNGNQLEFDVGSHKVAKHPRDAYKYLSKFIDNVELQKQEPLRFTANGSVSRTIPRQFEVYLQKYDAYKTFNNPGDAIAYLKTDVRNLDDLSEIAWKKGLDLTVDSNGNYVLFSKTTRETAANLPELQKRLRDYPDLQHSVRSVLDEIDPDIESSVSDIVSMFHENRPRAGMNKFGLPPEFEFPERKPTSAFMSALKATEQTTFWVELVAKQTNDPQLLTAYRRVEHAARVADTENYKSMRFLDTLFREDSGKLIKRDSRQKIFYHLGMTSEEAAEGLQKQYAKATGKALEALTPEEEKIAAGLKRYYQSMSTKFGISYEKLIHEYMPRLRDLAADSNKGLLDELTIADELVGHMRQESPEFKFWAEHERTSDLIGYALKDDALEVAMLYTTQGNKKLYMNDAWKELSAYMKNTNIDQGIAHRFNMYREALMGATRTPGEKAVEDFGEKFFVALKKNPVIGRFFSASEIEMRAKGRELLRSVLGITYISSLGWKPFLAIRNSLQPWSTAAPRLGVEWIHKGMEKVLKNPDVYNKKALSLGVITDKPPVVNQVGNHYSAWGKFSESSLQMFKNSDDYTRVWVYEAASDKFDNAINALKQNRIAGRMQFEDLSGMDMMDPVLRDEVWKLMEKGGDLDAAMARHKFAFKFQEETMFPYRASEAPLMYQGVIGKLFGQFGTYSMAYRANIARMFQHAPYAKRAQMVASYLAISGALWGTFNAMRIKTTDFIPFAPAMFNGGPWFDIAFDSVKAPDPGFEGQQARARLKSQLPTMLPGSAQLRYVKKALEYSEKGDSYRAWLSLTGVPMFED